MSLTERQIQIQIVKWLRTERHFVLHIPNEGKRSPREYAILKKMGFIPGASDLLILDLGCAIEVKRPGEDPTHKQRLFLQALRSVGWTVGVARSLEDAQRITHEARSTH